MLKLETENKTLRKKLLVEVFDHGRHKVAQRGWTFNFCQKNETEKKRKEKKRKERPNDKRNKERRK